MESCENLLINQLVTTKWSDHYKRQVIKEYEKFLYMKSQNDSVSPSNDIDLVWHQHILNTKHYRQYCYDNFGFFVDHDPTDAFDQEARKRRLQSAIDNFRKSFGPINPKIWNVSQNKPVQNKPIQKKIIWYDCKESYDNYKQNKPQLKIIFYSNNSDIKIMYLSKTDITLKHLATIIERKNSNKPENMLHIRWLTKDPSKSTNTSNLLGDLRHISDTEDYNNKISYYYKNQIELIAYYTHPNEGC